MYFYDNFKMLPSFSSAMHYIAKNIKKGRWRKIDVCVRCPKHTQKSFKICVPVFVVAFIFVFFMRTIIYTTTTKRNTAKSLKKGYQKVLLQYPLRLFPGIGKLFDLFSTKNKYLLDFSKFDLKEGQYLE
jgi:hypothetical protein